MKHSLSETSPVAIARPRGAPRFEAFSPKLGRRVCFYRRAVLEQWLSNWLTMLSRNCEYAVDASDFEEPFEQEFDYISTLWASAANRTEFERMRSISSVLV